MQIEQQDSSRCEALLQPEGALTSDGNAIAPASTPDHAMLPQSVKRPTRQWAAWTREEEESFFSALRQVGKNFEKITCCVKSKNKDQVRHYYYRLVRRMNKLLGPRLCLDAKNSKDTNAAMLRWWSLLEKYSCKASKLHLKPRRFKIFVEALEHQLLKDRKKNVRKRSQGENSSPSVCTFSTQSRPPAHDNHTIKMVLVDSQNIQKLGPGKPSFKRGVGLGTNRGNNKGESMSVKQPRQRRKSGLISSTAYKKWEEAAIAGVSLVADAAEHVERSAADAAERVKITADAANDVNCTSADAAEHLNCNTVDIAQHFPSIVVDKDIGCDQNGAGQRGSDPDGGSHRPLLPLSQNHLEGVQTCSKLKLQLFPIDDGTRRALEMDKHNPHLELTLGTRKKISSVLEHMNRKWGSSSVAHGELMLFPYGIQRENLKSCTRWTQDSICSAADVYATIGSPPVFRLWYGWFTNIGAPVGFSCFAGDNSPVASNCSKKVGDVHRNQLLSVTKNPVVVHSTNDTQEQINGYAAESCCVKETANEKMKQNEGDQPRIASTAAAPAAEWADSLTNISVGDLLLEVAQSEEVSGAETSVQKDPSCAEQYPISCDSFDAAIAAHVLKYQDKVAFQPTFSSHVSSSIWDAEDTCDAFSFQKSSAAYKDAPCGNISSGATEASERTTPAGSDGLAEETEVEMAVKNPAHDDPIEDYLSDQILAKNPTTDFSGLTDIYWPESLGPLDLDIPSPSYCSEDLIVGDSLSCLNRLIASSLDAFQNCSFFGTDKKEPDPAAAESQEKAPFSLSS